MRKVWWSWDLRMRWQPGFAFSESAYVANYKAAVDAAEKYGVEAIVIWGFLRDLHGGVDAAKRLCDYAYKRNVAIYPGVGVDHYGGVFYAGDSEWSLDTYLTAHPEAQAVTEDGSPKEVRWPPTDPGARKIGCASRPELMEYYKASIAWLIETFDLQGFQIEQGDNGLCHCEQCRANRGKIVHKYGSNDFSRSRERIVPVVEHALSIRNDLTILCETYCGLEPEILEGVRDEVALYPDAITLSWQVYRPLPGKEGTFRINEHSRNPKPHGCLAITTNSDAADGEREDVENIRKLVRLGKNADLDMTYLYGEYPDRWPWTRANYEAWSESAE